jgi:hypothetical protein
VVVAAVTVALLHQKNTIFAAVLLKLVPVIVTAAPTSPVNGEMK